MSFAARPMPIASAAAPPAKWAMGFNFRNTEGTGGDGPIDVWARLQNYPTSFSNASHTTDAGWDGGPAGAIDKTSSDRRIGGNCYVGTVMFWKIRLPSAFSSVRVYVGGWGNGGVSAQIRIFNGLDGFTRMIHDSANTGVIAADEVSTVLGTKRPTVADWTANYSSDVFTSGPLTDLGANTGLNIRINRDSGSFAVIAHIRVEEV